MGNIYSGKDFVYAMAEESTFGTAVADSGDAIQLSCANFTINRDLKFRTPDRASGQRFPDIADISADVKGSVFNCAIPTEVLKNELAYWLYLVLQNVTEGDTTPYTKTFNTPATSEIPDFASNEGLFITLWKKSPVSSTSEKLTSLIGGKLELSLSPDANNGNLFGNIQLVGFKGYSRTANPTGTWTKSTQSKFNFHDIQTFTIGGNACVLKDWKLTIESNPLPVGPDGSGSWANFVLSNFSVINEMTIVWDANARTALSNMDSGAEQDVILEWGSSGNDGHLKFEVKGKFQSGDLVEGETEDVTLSLVGASDLADSEELLTVTLSDAQDLSW